MRGAVSVAGLMGIGVGMDDATGAADNFGCCKGGGNGCGIGTDFVEERGRIGSFGTVGQGIPSSKSSSQFVSGTHM